MPLENSLEESLLKIKLSEDALTTARYHYAELTPIILHTAGLTYFSVSRGLLAQKKQPALPSSLFQHTGFRFSHCWLEA